ncbi:hypothetical protein E2R58_18620 [Paenibacillus amylolyticus]|uniref:hypothetical protein n=1 Tax=Paenibacillus amylolyticus TaxID=1451 RepID=UPI0010595B18|nr:hypothetical protein [Paenibacillus amylolyticus]TDL65492.1 hypothetical protein E2R58_18620 [Paenibacillus amylolyticus]
MNEVGNQNVMEPLEVIPMVGIGPFKLGMSKSEVEEIIECITPEISQLYNQLEYDSEHKLYFIEVSNPHDYSPDESDVVLTYDNIDVFRTKADDLVKLIDSKTPYTRDIDAELGFSFIFKDIQLALWRPSVMTEEMLNSVEFLTEFSPENQELEKRFFYFRTVAVAAPGYFNRT